MRKLKLFSLALMALFATSVWGAASTSSDGKYASGTIDFSTIGTLSGTTTYWHNGVKFYSGNATSISANNTAWSETISIPAYISSKTAGKEANKAKWGTGGGKQYTMSGFACSQHTIGVHVNQPCTLTVVVNKNVGSDTDDAGITASVDGVAYGTAYTSSDYKEAGSKALTVTSAREDKTNAPGRYTLTIVVKNSDLTDGEAVVKMFNGSSGSGAGKLFCWESITVTAACAAETPSAITKGTLSDGNLPLLSGTPAANNVWYWQDSEDGTSTSNPYSTVTPRTVNETGTYYLRSYYNSSCWGEAQSITLTDIDFTANYTVVYKDGETPLGSETVEVGEKPTASGISTTKDFYTFAAWQLGGVDKALTDDSWALVEANATVTLTARWTAPLYTSGNYVFENNATVGTNPSKTVTTTKTTYPAFHIDNIYFDGMDIQYEDGKYSGEGDDFKGWKIKSEAKTIRFLVENNSQVTAQMGNLSSGCNITYTPITGAATTEALAAKTANKYNVKAGTIVTLTTQGSNTVTLKQIAVVPVYAVTCADAENGSVTADKAQAIAGETVTLTVTADPGYKVTSVKYNDVVVEPVESVYSFTMPAEAVTVTAVFSLATGIENQESKIDNRKFFKDGQLFIEKNGHVYNVFGTCIK